MQTEGTNLINTITDAWHQVNRYNMLKKLSPLNKVQNISSVLCVKFCLLISVKLYNITLHHRHVIIFYIKVSYNKIAYSHMTDGGHNILP